MKSGFWSVSVTASKRGYLLVSIFCLSIFLFGCSGSPTENNKEEKMNETLPQISEKVRLAIHNIQNTHFLFGHHSVGNNMLDGIRDLANVTGVDLVIKNIDDDKLSTDINIAEFYPGQNTNPKSKVDGFVEKIRHLNNAYIPNIAVMKFCWIDFPPDANLEDILSYYKEKLETLKGENPKVIFAHITVPLTMRPVNIKAKVKRMLHLQVWDDASNVSRTKFNNLLREEFSQGPIFDLARIESTQLDGTRVVFNYKGGTYYCLAPEYTNDGGHLNMLGRRVVASKFVVFLAETLKSKK